MATKCSGMRSLLAVVLALAILPGCTYGFIYSNTTEPLTKDMRAAPRSEVLCRGKSFSLKEPLTVGGLRIEWATHAIGDAAKHCGLEHIYYADLRSQHILGGLWRRDTVLVYGSK